MASTLIARGHEVLVVCIENTETQGVNELTWSDDVFDGIPVRRLSFNRNSIPDPDRFEFDNPWIGDHFAHLFEEFQPDVYHMVSGYLITGRPIWEAHEQGIPTVISLEDFWFLCPRITMLRKDGKLNALPLDPFTCARCLSEDRRRYQVLDKLAPTLMERYWHLQKTKAQGIEERSDFLMKTLHESDLIIGRSKFLCSTYLQAGVPAEKIIYSRQGLDFPRRSPLDIKTTVPHTLRVGFLGQIASHKGVHVLIDAVRLVTDPRLELEIYGSLDRFPAYTSKLKELAHGDGRIRLAGAYRGYEGEVRVLRNLDVVVVPSLWYENCPNSILESFAQRTPVVASNLGGMAELVQHEVNGLLFEVGNAKDLAAQLKRLLDDPELLPSLRAGIGPMKTVSQEIDELEVAYQNVLIRSKAKIRIEQSAEG